MGLNVVSEELEKAQTRAASFVTSNAPVICIQRPLGAGISGAFNFSIFKAPLKALHSGAKLVVKSLLKALALPGTDNNEEQQMT